MFIVIGIMFAGIGIGYLLRSIRLRQIGRCITLLIWVLLFLLGIEVGNNQTLINALPTLGLEAVLISFFGIFASCVAAWGLWKFVNRNRKEAQA